jgi:hypothetical protein
LLRICVPVAGRTDGTGPIIVTIILFKLLIQEASHAIRRLLRHIDCLWSFRVVRGGGHRPHGRRLNFLATSKYPAGPIAIVEATRGCTFTY